MYNHARTLLLNLTGTTLVADSFPCVELIPEDFVSVELPSYLRNLRTVLFGSDPDPEMLHYRGQQLMTLLHATELEEYVVALDSRITYLEDTTYTAALEEAFVPRVTSVYPEPLTIQGRPVSPDGSGHVYQLFDVDVLTPTTVEVHRLRPGARRWTSALTLTNGLSAPIELSGTGYSVVLPVDDPAGRWRVSVFLRPQRSLGELAAMLAQIGEDNLVQLFGAAPAEPYLTFRNLWERNPELPYQLGGLLLAVIYRTEALRNA